MTEPKYDMSIKERRRKLLAEGALLRMGIMAARGTVRANLNTGFMAKIAMNRLVGTVASTFSGAFSSQGTGLQSLSPLFIGGLSLLSKRWLYKPLLYAGIISVGTAVFCLARKRSRVAKTMPAYSADVTHINN